MMYAPPGWTRRSTADGVVLLPNGGVEIGHVIYRERVRPLRPVLEIFRGMLASDAEADVDVTTLRPRLVITNEGEYAAMATVRSRAGDVQHEFGVVLLDDYHSMLHGVTRDPARFDEHSVIFFDLVVFDTHQLGVRRRRYLHDKPSRWQGRPRGLETDYFPLDYPQQDLMLTVLPAQPRPPNSDSAKFVEALLETQRKQFAIADIGGLAAVQTPHLPGSELNWTCLSDQRQLGRRVVVLEDERYLYPVFLEGTSELALAKEQFIAVVNSIEPIPTARSLDAVEKSTKAKALSMWEEE